MVPGETILQIQSRILPMIESAMNEVQATLEPTEHNPGTYAQADIAHQAIDGIPQYKPSPHYSIRAHSDIASRFKEKRSSKKEVRKKTSKNV